MKADVAIVACGARTPVGLTAWTSAASVRAGISRLYLHPYLIDQYGDAMRVGMDGVMSEDLAGEDRMFVMAESALREVCRELGSFLPRAGLYLGLPESRPGWSTDAGMPLAHALIHRVAPELPLEHVSVLPLGHAAAIEGVARAVKALRAEEHELVIVGGVDSYLHVDTLEWLDENGQLYNDRDSRSSFVPGEGAGFCALALPSWCRAHRVPMLARVVGIGIAEEPNRIKTETVCVGEGLSEAVREATSGLSLPEEKIGDTFCDLNGERYRTEEFAFCTLRNHHPFEDANHFIAPADRWGDVGAASGVLLTICAVASGMRRYARAGHAMVFAGSEGGLRGAVVLRLGRGH